MALDDEIVPSEDKYCVRENDDWRDGEDCVDSCDVADDRCGLDSNSAWASF